MGQHACSGGKQITPVGFDDAEELALAFRQHLAGWPFMRSSCPVDKQVQTFAFVLHTHLPYSRFAGRWPHGEEWLFEAICETYLPLLEVLQQLSTQMPFALTLTLTPVLLEQLQSAEVMQQAEQYMLERETRATQDQRRFERAGESQLAGLAAFYRDWFRSRRLALIEQFNGDLIGAFRGLWERGTIEVVGSAATHAFLPLLSRDSSIRAQLAAGLDSHERLLGRRPAGFWLPECAYRPRTLSPDGLARPGLEEHLAAWGFRFFFVESHALSPGASTAEIVPPHYRVCSSSGSKPEHAPHPVPGGVQPYCWVGDAAVVAIARDHALSMQVWSADTGYPGDGVYREFHKKDEVSGLQYWAVTSKQADLGSKALYDPVAARSRAIQHADHFASSVLHRFEGGTEELVVVAFDTELFGHWWFEGPIWLQRVLGQLQQAGRNLLRPLREHLRLAPPHRRATLAPSSWGQGGDWSTWLNSHTQGLWESLGAAEQNMERLAVGVPEGRLRYAAQAAREILLAQASDWPFLITTGQAREYAWQRFETHLERFRVLGQLALATQELGPEHESYLRKLEREDAVFPSLDLTWFLERQGSV